MMLKLQLKNQDFYRQNFQGINCVVFSINELNCDDKEIIDEFIKSKYFLEESVHQNIKSNPDGKKYLQRVFNFDKTDVNDFRRYSKEGVIVFFDNYFNRKVETDEAKDYFSLNDHFKEIVNRSLSNDYYLIDKYWFERNNEKVFDLEYTIYSYYIIVIFINRASNELVVCEWIYN